MVTFETILTNGVRLHTALAGQEDGPPVILLHGFPDAWFGWKRQIGPLAAAGFRVIAPDQRGYNLSDKPQSIAAYRMETLVADILGLADALGLERFHLAGHDFGAMVSWNLAITHPQRLKRLAIANVPHPAVMQHFLRTHPKQMLKSWYAFFFQIPELPERLMRLGDWRTLINALPASLSTEERQRYREAWAQPGAMTAMINWYRAFLRYATAPAPTEKIHVPTLILWGKGDRYLSHEMAPLSAEQCTDARLVIFHDATHWVLHDKAQAVNRLLIEHFLGQV